MPHQAVEVVGAGGSCINLLIQDLGLLRKMMSKFLGDAGCLFQGCAVRHVNDDLELALIIEGEHLHANEL